MAISVIVNISILYSAMDLEESFFNDSEDELFLNSIDEDLDFAFALSLQAAYDEDTDENSVKQGSASSSSVGSSAKPLSIVDEQWELIDPNPDIHSLFLQYDARFFYGKLQAVEVKWSPRMTHCAGICCYEGRGRLCSIRLSLPLLKLRPRRDLVETLLHEMIHAYLFVTENNKDRSGHGPEFLSHMHRINKETGARITVFHTFHDEVELYRTHWWKCDGPCQNKRPFFGIVKRAMNRAPGPNDNWWAQHQATCGGKFIKIKEPENYGKKRVPKRKIPFNETKSGIFGKDIRSFFGNENQKSDKNVRKDPNGINEEIMNASDVNMIKSIFAAEDNIVGLNRQPSKSSSPPLSKKRSTIIPFSGSGHKLGSSGNAPRSLPFLIRKDFLLNSSVQTAGSSQNNVPCLGTLETSSSVKVQENKEYPMHTSSSKISSVCDEKKKLVQSPIRNFLNDSPRESVGAISKQKPNHQFSEESSSDNNDFKVNCPVCSLMIWNKEINSHLDNCIAKD